MMGTSRTGDKMPFKTNHSFNSTMMASFLPVIVSKKKQTNKEKYVFYCSVSQIHINPEKNTKMTGWYEKRGRSIKRERFNKRPNGNLSLNIQIYVINIHNIHITVSKPAKIIKTVEKINDNNN